MSERAKEKEREAVYIYVLKRAKIKVTTWPLRKRRHHKLHQTPAITKRPLPDLPSQGLGSWKKRMALPLAANPFVQLSDRVVTEVGKSGSSQPALQSQGPYCE